MRKTNDYFKKLKRKIMNEPESEIKDEKFELMTLVVNRTSEIVNWFDNLEAKELRKQKHEEELKRAEKKKADKIRATRMIEDNANVFEQQYNKGCRYFQDYGWGGTNASCVCGMDMTFCSKKCAYATNVVGSTKVVLEKRGRKKNDF